MVGGNRAALVLPAASIVACICAASAIFVPGLMLAVDRDQVAIAVTTLVLAGLGTTCVATFFGVAFAAVVHAQLEGVRMELATALRIAWSRRRAIVGWALLTNAVGWAFRLLEEVGGDGIVVGVLGLVGEIAWSLATFFVVPVLALEGVGPVDALRRSAAVFKERWGEEFAGELAVGGPFLVGGLVSGSMIVFGFGATGTGLAWGPPLLLMGIFSSAALVVVAMAIRQVLSLVLYRYAEGLPLPPEFSAAAVERAFPPRES